MISNRYPRYQAVTYRYPVPTSPDRYRVTPLLNKGVTGNAMSAGGFRVCFGRTSVVGVDRQIAAVPNPSAAVIGACKSSAGDRQ